MYPSAEQVHFWLGTAYEAKKQFADAERELRLATELSLENAQFRAALGHLHAAAGDSAKAASVLDEMAALSQKQYVSAYSFAVLYAALGDRSHRLKQLRRARQERAEGVLYLNIEPYFDELRALPEFAEITRSIGL
jgi:Flp pilus assembly protein TadD